MTDALANWGNLKAQVPAFQKSSIQHRLRGVVTAGTRGTPRDSHLRADGT
jgi:hypothetical protein